MATPNQGESISISQAVLAPLDAIFKAQIHAARSFINMLWQMAYPHIPLDEDGHQMEIVNAYKDTDGKTVYEGLNKKFFYFDAGGKKTDYDAFDPANPPKPQVEINTPYTFPLRFKAGSGANSKDYTMEIPTIAMVPITPLGIDEASITFDMSISGMESHQQLQNAEKKKFTAAATTGGTDAAAAAAKQEGDGYGDKKRPWYLVNEPKSLLGNIEAKNSQNSSLHIEIKMSKAPVPAALEKSLTVLTQSISMAENNTPAATSPPAAAALASPPANAGI